jgi:hypothetical protein
MDPSPITFVLRRIFKLAIQDECWWVLEDLVDDPRLDDISPELRETVMAGNVDIPSLLPIIRIDDVDDQDNFTVVCHCGYDEETKKLKEKEFTWSVEQVKKFLDYFDK